jgi:hypothetical protein
MALTFSSVIFLFRHALVHLLFKRLSAPAKMFSFGGTVFDFNLFEKLFHPLCPKPIILHLYLINGELPSKGKIFLRRLTVSKRNLGQEISNIVSVFHLAEYKYFAFIFLL